MQAVFLSVFSYSLFSNVSYLADILWCCWTHLWLILGRRQQREQQQQRALAGTHGDWQGPMPTIQPNQPDC